MDSLLKLSFSLASEFHYYVFSKGTVMNSVQIGHLPSWPAHDTYQIMKTFIKKMRKKKPTSSLQRQILVLKLNLKSVVEIFVFT